ncbi:hypothetical protein INR77_04245 [Erythrobacter sp. SCSIO 43205]|uniref:hypothetical protein n=1 Tax=Erythrobacter sp. SCSIO 43205 TaxID=2779361 RepID=UPI001CA9099E|nr:hypothetical protein [Erythrobacter sp. SCSIO 43205]UAB78918.1 hypothetical protein INR77_04245 [Erythrobacter sp. SCSIO 43205]
MDYDKVTEIRSTFLDEWVSMPELRITSGDRIEFKDGTVSLGQLKLDEINELVGRDAIIAFVLSHEAWHWVQSQGYTPNQISQLQEARMLECEADFMGGFASYRALKSVDMNRSELEAAKLAIEAFIAVNQPQNDELRHYPPQNRRRSVFGLGWSQARSGQALSLSGNLSEQVPNEIEVLSQICLRITEASDGSLGQIWTRSRTKSVDGGFEILVEIENQSNRPISVGTLALGTVNIAQRGRRTISGTPRVGFIEPDGPSRIATAYHAVIDQITVGGGAQATRSLYIPHDRTLEEGDEADYRRRYFGTEYPFAFLGTGNLVTSRYADLAPSSQPIGIRTDQRHCITRQQRPPRRSDRALFNRITLAAKTANENFRPLAGTRVRDNPYLGRSIALRDGVRQSEWDVINLNGILPPNVQLSAFESEDVDALESEFQRLKGLFSELCGESAMSVTAPFIGAKSDMDTFYVREFADGVELSVRKSLFASVRAQYQEYLRNNLAEEGFDLPPRREGGRIVVTIFRDLGL